MRLKERRHNRILEIIKATPIETQDDLVEILNAEGFKTTQATISRDIKELHLYKTLTKENKYRYECTDFVPEVNKNPILSKYYNIMRDSIINVDHTMNLVIVKCYSGMAQAACAAIDALDDGDVLGTIAGDDTIFIAVKNPEISKKIASNIDNIINA